MLALMPLRPAPYEWVLPGLDQAELAASAEAIGERFGFTVRRESSALVLEGSRAAVDRAAEYYGSVTDEIEPPGELGRYRFRLAIALPDEDDPRPRIALEPRADNWAAWSVAGPLAEDVATAMQATEITGDPPPWAQKALAQEEAALPPRLPAIAVRGPLVLPGLVTTVTFGRPASKAAIERLLAADRLRVVIVVQADPSSEALPTGLAQIHPIGIDARILRTVEVDAGRVLVVKGIARVRVRDLGAQDAAVEEIPESGPPSRRFAALRDFASLDPLVADALGATRLAKVDALEAGFLADVVAKTLGGKIALKAYLEPDATARALLVEAAIARQ